MAEFLSGESGGDAGGRVRPWSALSPANTLSEHARSPAGVCTATADGFLVGIRELLKIRRFPDGIMHTENDLANGRRSRRTVWTSMNCWGFTPALFGELETPLPSSCGPAGGHRQGRVSSSPRCRRSHPEKKGAGQDPPDRERWFGVTYPEDRPPSGRPSSSSSRPGLSPTSGRASDRAARTKPVAARAAR